MSCAEGIDLDDCGIVHGSCIDEDLIARLSGFGLSVKKDKTQKRHCCCAESIDLGAYSTCLHGCLYCYANRDRNRTKRALALHDPQSPLIVGNVDPADRITERKSVSCFEHQERIAF